MTSRLRDRSALLAAALAGVLSLALSLGCSSGSHAQSTTASSAKNSKQPLAPAARKGGRTHHYGYVLPDEAMYVYDIDARHRLVQKVALPRAKGIRGVVASPPTHTLYVSYGGGGGANGKGAMLGDDLVRGPGVWAPSSP